MDFGTLAVPGNAAVHYLELGLNGSIRSQDGVIVVSSPTTGLYDVSGFPPNAQLDIEVDDISLTRNDSGLPEVLLVSQYTSTSVTVDATGYGEFTLAATIESSGSGNPYADGDYSGDGVMRIRYWSPADGAYLTLSDTVTIRAALRTSVLIEQVQAMSFGELFAVADPVEQASLVLRPDGRVTIDNNPPARIVQIAKGEPGVLRISGAASHYALTVDVQAGSIELVHTSNPSAPKFIVEDFVTSPSGTLTTDDSGMAELMVGATLKTDATGSTTTYPDGTYQGEYELTVSY